MDGKWWYHLVSWLQQGNSIVPIPYLSILFMLYACLPLKIYIYLLCSVRVSNELGKGSAKAAKFSIVVTVLTSLAIGSFLFLFFLFFRERLAYIFTSNKEVAAAVGELSPLLSISILLNSVQPVLSGTSSYNISSLFGDLMNWFKTWILMQINLQWFDEYERDKNKNVISFHFNRSGYWSRLAKHSGICEHRLLLHHRYSCWDCSW